MQRGSNGVTVVVRRNPADPRRSIGRGGVVAREQETAALLAAIVESSDDAIIGQSLDGIIFTWNWGAEQMYRYTAAEAVGRNVSMLVPPGLPEELPAMLARVGRGERAEHYETQRMRRDGSVFDVSVTISPILDTHGTIIGASSVTRDITQRKRSEAELRELQERLHQAQRLETVGQLAGGIAHDFNNLLTGIMNYADLIGVGLANLSSRYGLAGDDGAASVTHGVTEIKDVARRGARLTRQLLVFTRPEVLKSEVLDINGVVREAEGMLRRTIGEAVEVHIDLGEHLPLTKADRGQVEQILMNLAVNARDAMAGRGQLRIVTTRFDADEAYARRHGVAPGEFARLSVSDTGAGMSAEVAARALEAFFTTKRRKGGSGLGLATVNSVVTAAGGNVSIISELGLGTTIQVDLPATNDAPTVSPVIAPEEPGQSSGETILLVEDESIVRDPLCQILALSGYAVLAASNAHDALSLIDARQGEIDLLLTDLVMPGRSGKELADEVREASPDTKVLYMSGYSSEDLILDLSAHTNPGLIEKPFTAEHLLWTVRKVLDRSSA
ncbi:MAG: putative multi-sensor signal transduction histidine kinase [Acidimicrobiia bacterium]|nr:putative multi-sensor signal transduction histidine kinase [Acidimicrobiia bacterium]